MFTTADASIAATAARQYGVFDRRQVLDAGFTPRMVESRLASGRWLAVAYGVYAFADHPPSFRRSLWIAKLDAGPKALVSHESGGTLHTFSGCPPSRFAVSVPHGAHHRNSIATVHQTTRPATPVFVDGLPVTPPARTIVDLAKVMGPRRLAHILDDAVARRLVGLERVRRCWLDLAVSGRPGMEMLGRLLHERGEGFVPPRSELERALDFVLAQVPGPPPVREFDIAGWGERPQRVDRLYGDEFVIVEGDGRAWHTRVADFARDRRRDRLAVRKKYTPLRYAYEELVGDTEDVVDELCDILGRPRPVVAIAS